MSAHLDWKKFQFITIVQTALINNAINLSQQNGAENLSNIISATATLIIMDDAFYAAERIPANMAAREAASEFIGFMLENLREPDDKVPEWFKRF